MTTPKGCAPARWKKASDDEKRLFCDFFSRFNNELAVLKECPKSSDETIAHNLAWVTVWTLTNAVKQNMKRDMEVTMACGGKKKPKGIK